MPSYPIDPDKLLGQASELAGEGAGRGRPSYTGHRRAVSSAYYAVFHEVTRQVAQRLFPDSREFQMHARRSVAHGAVYDVCRWISGMSPPQHLAPIVEELRADSDLVSLAESFMQLKEAREEADYDHTRPFNKRETLTLLEEARQAIAKLRLDSPAVRDAMSLVALKATAR